MADEFLTPSYLETDFTTLKTKLQELMLQSDTFKDYNYEGSNITMLMELLSYLGDLSTFYVNLLTKNVYEDTADVYEAVHRLVRQKGYNPVGYRSGQATISVTITGGNSTFENGNELQIEDGTGATQWISYNTNSSTSDNIPIYYTLTNEPDDLTVSLTTTAVSGVSAYNFNIYLREGPVISITYDGNDIVDDQIVLPFYNFDHGAYPFEIPAILVEVNGTEWRRVPDFYDEVSGLNDYGMISGETTENDNVFMFRYDKYQRYVLEFSTARNVPLTSDTIDVKMLRSNALNGIIGANADWDGDADPTTTFAPDNFIVVNVTTSQTISAGQIRFVNHEASTGAALPQTIGEIKVSSKGLVHSQERNITRIDYVSHLKSDSSIIGANAWGEQELNPLTENPLIINVLNYNKIFISTVPERTEYTEEAPSTPVDYWANGMFSTTAKVWDDTSTVPAVQGTVWIPQQYYTTFKAFTYSFLEERRALNIYEYFQIPDVVYFKFELGLRTKRIYNWTLVSEAIKAKLYYYFDPTLRQYNEEINFMDIHNFILDTSITHESYETSQIRGINNLVFRDIVTYTDSLSAVELIYEENDLNHFPYYTQTEKEGHVDNTLRPIKIGHDQFPAVQIQMCTFVNEG